MKSLKPYIILSYLLLCNIVWPQTLTQTLRGRVVDQDTQVPLIGANVFVRNTDPVRGAITDLDGYFRILAMPVGRYDIQANYIGYDNSVIPEVVISSAKEVILSIQLKESFIEMEAVVVFASRPKEKPQNAMAVVSARGFTVEETRRYAGGLDDPARLASSFAGVSTGAPQDNAIVVRGNSPKGLLWQIEGVKVPNPNHFPDINVAGGGFVSILSSQVVGNSDFYTGAFPAEYGNALGGVFDIKLRDGNDEQREYTLQAGLLGIDLAAEGPLAIGNNSSYLFNYRYATMSLIADLIPSEQIPKYSDLSFKVAIPTKTYGKFSIWGVGALDENEEYETADSTEWATAWDRAAYDLTIDIGVVGVSHIILVGKNAYVSSSLAQSIFNTKFHIRRLDDGLNLQDNFILDNQTGTTTISSNINRKFSPRHTNRTGIIYNHLAYSLKQSAAIDNQLPLTTLVNKDDAAALLQIYSQSRINLSENILLNVGFHSQSFQVSGETTFEPRLGLTWKFSPAKTVSLGYGNHSQLEELRVYFIENDNSHPNRKLEMSRAHHIVLAYDQQINSNLRLKIEPYYQLAYNVPVIQDSSYSMLNFRQDWTFNSALVNDGTGTNLGVDITLERFLENDMYYLFTASIFDSKYRGGDNIERSTGYATGYTVNGLFGKEFYVGKTKQNVLGINFKLSAAGGARLSPANMVRTRAAREFITDEYKTFEDRAPDLVLLDLSIIYRINRAAYTSSWALQIKNALGSNTLYYYDYDYKSDEVFAVEEAIVIPFLSYKIEF